MPKRHHTSGPAGRPHPPGVRQSAQAKTAIQDRGASGLRGSGLPAAPHPPQPHHLFRHRRRVDARDQLRMAHDMLAALGMEAFAERARRELIATGEKVRKRRVSTRHQLTPQEEQIARLADEGLSNPEIGARLFLSARTVEWHLGKVFTKLGIGSRRELNAALAQLGQDRPPA
jgi:DNA-binding CsgD family transcriptional regulator